MKQRQMYHFTSQFHLEMLGIKECGLTPGDVPLPLHGLGINAVWLTTDPCFEHQQWARISPVDKTELRISVSVDLEDKRLLTWAEYAKEVGIAEVPGEMSPACFAETYMYRGFVFPDQFEKVEYRIVDNGKETIKEYDPSAGLVAELPPVWAMKIGEYTAMWVDDSAPALLKIRRIAEKSLT